MVESIGLLDNFKQSTFGGRPAIIVQNDLYPLNFLAQLLSLPLGELDVKAPILLVRTDRHRIALVVDEIKGKIDVVMKNLGPHLRDVHGVAGGTVLANGRVVLFLELIELLSSRSGAMSGASGTIAPPALREVSPVQTYQSGTRAEVGVPTQSRTTTVPT